LKKLALQHRHLLLNGHGHCAVLLAMPVARHAAARVDLLLFFSRSRARHCPAARRRSPLQWAHHQNPVHPYWPVEWRRDEAYTLPELSDWLFSGDMQPDFFVE
jgi:hypothetical protein